MASRRLIPAHAARLWLTGTDLLLPCAEQFTLPPPTAAAVTFDFVSFPLRRPTGQVQPSSSENL